MNDNIIIDEVRNVYIETYFLKQSKELKPNHKRPVVLVCPGGGYRYTSDREAEPIALSYNAQGFHSVVLRYGCEELGITPGPLFDLAKTMKFLHENEDKYAIDVNNIFVIGFSAGGHLAGSLSVFHNNADILKEHANTSYIKPKAILLGYPMLDLDQTADAMYFGVDGYPDYEDIKFDELPKGLNPQDVFVRKNDKTYANMQIIINTVMAGKIPDTDFINQYSISKQVHKDACPTFLWHGGVDGLVYPKNSLNMAQALYKHNIDCEIHIFKNGDHGLGLANDVTENHPWESNVDCAKWFDLSVSFIKNLL